MFIHCKCAQLFSDWKPAWNSISPEKMFGHHNSQTSDSQRAIQAIFPTVKRASSSDDADGHFKSDSRAHFISANVKTVSDPAAARSAPATAQFADPSTPTKYAWVILRLSVTPITCS